MSAALHPFDDDPTKVTRARSQSGIHALTSIPGPGLLRYDIIELLACGGMGSVYLAARCRGREIERVVALKRRHVRLEEDQTQVHAGLREEARLGARLRHPNLVPTVDLVDTREGPTLVMEFVEGVTLRDLSPPRSGPYQRPPFGVSARVLADVLMGLHELHELRDEKGKPLEYVHRDVAPGNVLVGADGLARITDFGLAQAGHQRVGAPPRLVQGTLRYLAPEQARGEWVDRRADVFAVGALLWELLTGHRLVHADGALAILREASRGPTRAWSSGPKDVPPHLFAVCRKALKFDPESRWPTARSFALAILQAMEKDGLSTRHEAVESWVQKTYGARFDRQAERIAEWRSAMDPPVSSSLPSTLPEAV